VRAGAILERPHGWSVMFSMSPNEFWECIEQCRQQSDSMRTFNLVLEATLDTWELPKLAAFHKIMWCDIGVNNDDDLWEIVEPLTGIGGDDTWECYGGWLIAQGRQFHEEVMRNPKAAATRIPPLDDIYEGESVIFAAQRVCRKKTGDKWSLYDLFGDDLSGKPLPGVDFPVSW
jgi:hypothetical protein